MRTASTAPSASSVSLPKRRVRTTLFSSMRVNLKHAHCVIEGSIDLDSRQKQGGSRFLVLRDTLLVIVSPGLDNERLSGGRSNHARQVPTPSTRRGSSQDASHPKVGPCRTRPLGSCRSPKHHPMAWRPCLRPCRGAYDEIPGTYAP